MELNKQFFEKVFSTKRMERYFTLYPNDEKRAIKHYECNQMLSESLYTCLSVLEVTLRNALCRELETMTGREDWYAIFPTTPGLRSLNRYITEAGQHITGRHEQITPSKIVAELTLGFWVSLLNSIWKEGNDNARTYQLPSICSVVYVIAYSTMNPFVGICHVLKKYMQRF